MFESLWKRRPFSVFAGRVSVVIPLYNHATYIEQAIDSALSQGAIVREIIVIDDGSTDDSAVVMRRIAKRNVKIAFHSRPNLGAHATINEGLSRCSGDFLAILNSDDCYLPGRLEALAVLLEGEPDSALAASAIDFMDGDGKKIVNNWYEEALGFYRSGQDMGVALVNANFLMTTSNFVIRRSAIEQFGGFAALRYTHDLDFALRILARGMQIALSEEKLLSYRIHSSNTIAEDHSKVRTEWAIAAGAYLNALWHRPGAPSIDCDHAAAVEAVLQRHELTHAAHLSMAYLRRHSDDLIPNVILSDSTFKDQIAQLV